MGGIGDWSDSDVDPMKMSFESSHDLAYSDIKSANLIIILTSKANRPSSKILRRATAKAWNLWAFMGIATEIFGFIYCRSVDL